MNEKLASTVEGVYKEVRLLRKELKRYKAWIERAALYMMGITIRDDGDVHLRGCDVEEGKACSCGSSPSREQEIRKRSN